MDFSNPGHIKLSLLAKGLNISNAARSGVGARFQEKIYSYTLTDWVDGKVVFPSDIKLGDRVYVGFRYRANSPWQLELREDNNLSLLHNGKFICIPKYIMRPYYYDHTTFDGILLQSVGVSCANHGISFFINNHCQYFNNNQQCLFCSLVPTQKKYNDTLRFKSRSHVEETLRKAIELGCTFRFIQLSGGSIYSHNLEVRLYFEYIKAIYKILDDYGIKEKIPIHLTCMPPSDLSLIKQLKDEGLDTISFNLECVSEKYFNRYCPGKAKSYGYSNMRNALNYAVNEFGKGNVFSITIMGIEPSEVFLPGIEKLLSDDIVPTLNIYHQDPYSAHLMDVDEPNVESLIENTNKIGHMFKKYKCKPGLLGCAHYDIGHEIEKGYFGHGT